MAISEFEIKRCEKELKKFMELRRPPVHIRNELDMSYRIKDQSVEIIEIRPQWDDPTKKIETAVAKSTYIKKEKCWKIYWQRQDMKWHAYEPMEKVSTFEEFLSIVNEDAYACFFG